MTKPAAPPPVRAAPRPALSSMEGYYFRVLCHWYRFKRVAPSLADLADLCRRSGRPESAGHDAIVGRNWPTRRALYRGLIAIERKGYARRNTKGKFEVIRLNEVAGILDPDWQPLDYKDDEPAAQPASDEAGFGA